MSHSLRTRSFAALGLMLASAGIIAAACSSDSSSEPSTENPQLTPGNSGDTPNPPSMPADNGTEPGPNGSMDNGNPGTPGNGEPPSNGNEGQPGDLPIEPPPAETPGETGNEPPAPPPPTGALAPNCNPPEGNVPNLTLELVAGNLSQPIYVTQAPGDDSRLFIMEQGGAVRVLVNGEMQEAPFINVSGMLTARGEQGLLGMAFHPDYATNGLFYLHFSGLTGQGMARDTVIAEFQVDPNNRSVADPNSRRDVLGIVQPEPNHNGGQITFGPDRMLYLGFGDGGGGDDQHGNPGNGQSLNTLLGKMLRIDPLGRDVGNAYSVPAGNLAEVTGLQARAEIWAYGLRNPWRFSFDACSGDLYIGDVGQQATEEIDFLAADPGSRTVAAGTNFGWRLMEGPVCRPNDGNCNAQTQAGLTLPVDSYGRAVGQSVTGGFVYRGSNIPGLRGNYIYADYQSARFFRFRMVNGQIADRFEITDQMRPAGGGNIDQISSFGMDNAGETYVAAFTPGAVYRIAAAP